MSTKTPSRIVRKAAVQVSFGIEKGVFSGVRPMHARSRRGSPIRSYRAAPCEVYVLGKEMGCSRSRLEAC